MISRMESSTARSAQMRSFFWSVFSCIWTEYRDLWNKCPYSIRYRKIRARKKSVFGHFSHSVEYYVCLSFRRVVRQQCMVFSKTIALRLIWKVELFLKIIKYDIIDIIRCFKDDKCFFFCNNLYCNHLISDSIKL